MEPPLIFLPVAQGSGQGRVLAAFMYKVYINELIKEISECKFSLTINDLQLGCPTFADDMTLLAPFPSFEKNRMEKPSCIQSYGVMSIMRPKVV